MTSIIRCEWASSDNNLYETYHDKEWGVPVYDDKTQFEFLILEGAQAGLSWLTILKRRENYRKAFANFDPKRVAQFDEEKIQELLNNEGIIRNKLKIRSAVKNARKFLEIQNEFGSFSNYIWKFVGDKPIINNWKKINDVPSKTLESIKLSNDLKKRGFNFVGPTIMYAYMQAMGLVNDHIVSCFKHPSEGISKDINE